MKWFITKKARLILSLFIAMAVFVVASSAVMAQTEPTRVGVSELPPVLQDVADSLGSAAWYKNANDTYTAEAYGYGIYGSSSTKKTYVYSADGTLISDSGQQTTTAGGGGIVGFLGDAVGSAVIVVLGWIIYGIVFVMGYLLTFIIWVFIELIQFNHFIDVPTVVTGWVVVRDLCNMFFVLILLFLAFATILRLPNYEIRRTLPKLILMVILINFSRTIFGLIIDFSQVIMLTFVNSFAQLGANDFISLFSVADYLSLDAVREAESIGTLATLGAMIGGGIAMLITLVVMVVLVAVILMRIVLLWLYVILSPLVFLGRAFPAAQQYTERIWSDFIKQVMIGPLLAFFIWLALATVQNTTNETSLLTHRTDNNAAVATAQFQGSLGAEEQRVSGLSGIFTAGPFQQYIIMIGLLIGGLMVSQQVGGAAGSIAGRGLNAIQKGRGWTTNKMKAAGVGTAQGTLSVAKATGKGLDTAFTQGKLTAGVQALKNKPAGAAALAGFGAGTAASGGNPLVGAGTGLIAAIGTTIAGKKVKDTFDNYAKIQRARASATQDKGKMRAEDGSKVDDISKAHEVWKTDDHAYHEVYKNASGTVVTAADKNGAQYLNEQGVKTDFEERAAFILDSETGAYLKPEAVIKEGSKESRYGEVTIDGKPHRINETDGKYYRVNEKGEFIDKDDESKVVTDPEKTDQMQILKSAIGVGPFYGTVGQMGERAQKFHDGWMSERAGARSAAEAAENEKIKKIMQQYAALSREEIGRLVEVEKDSAKKMAIALQAAQKGGITNPELKDKALDAVRSNASLLGEFNDAMNKNHAFVNYARTVKDTDGSKRVEIDEAAMAKAISAGKVKLSDQSTDDLAKIPKALDFMAAQLGGKLQSTLDSMNKTKRDQGNISKMLMSGVQSRGFEEDHFRIRKAAGAFSGDYLKAFQDTQGTVNEAKLQLSIQETSKAGTFADIKDSNMGNEMFKRNFAEAIGVNQLVAMTRSDDVDEARIKKFIAIISAHDAPGMQEKRRKIKENNVLSSYATW